MKRLIFVLIPLVAMGAMIVWRLDSKRKEVSARTRQREARMKSPPVVAVQPAQVRDIIHAYESIGTVESLFNVRIAPKIAGRIDFLEAREGDRVTKGQVLVRIDPSELEADVRSRQADLAEAQYRLAQAQISQNPTDVAVSTQIRQQQAAVASAKADYNQAVESYAAQQAAATAAVTEAQGRVASANAAISNAQAAIRSEQANLDNANAKYQRILDLYQQGFTAAQDVDDARTAVSVQQGSLDVAKGQLDAAKALRDSSVAQKQAAQQQAEIVKTKGKADIEAARAKVSQAEASLDYARANTAQRPAYRQNLAALRSAVAAAQADLKSAQARLSEAVLKSPLNGFVTGRYMDPGSVATSGQAILAVQAIRQVWVTVPIPEEVSRMIYISQMAEIRFDALPGRALKGKVSQINPSADPLSRQFSVRITLDNSQNLIKPGMFARVSIQTERVPSAIVVPREAVRQDETGPTVVVINDANETEIRPVTLGASDTSGIAITQGLKAGEKVVTLSANPLSKAGQAVRTGGAGGPEAKSRQPAGSAGKAPPQNPGS